MFEKINRCDARVISLNVCTKSFENVHLIYKNSYKANKKKKTVTRGTCIIT